MFSTLTGVRIMNVTDEWYYVRNGHPEGPVTLARLQIEAREGRLKQTDLVWREPMPQWVAAGGSSEIFASQSRTWNPPALRLQNASPNPAYQPQPIGYASRQTQAQASDIGQDAGIRLLLPVGRSGWAIAAGYCGLLAIIPIIGQLAIIFGILAIMEMRKNPNKHGMGRALTGLILGGLFTAAHLSAAASFFIH